MKIRNQFFAVMSMVILFGGSQAALADSTCDESTITSRNPNCRSDCVKEGCGSGAWCTAHCMP